MDGLIVKEKWNDMYVSGEKTLEVRGEKLNRKKMFVWHYLLESKTHRVRGLVRFDACIPVTEKNWTELSEFHCVRDMTYEQLLERYPHPYFWAVREVLDIRRETLYKPVSGAVKWIKNADVLIYHKRRESP